MRKLSRFLSFLLYKRLSFVAFIQILFLVTNESRFKKIVKRMEYQGYRDHESDRDNVSRSLFGSEKDNAVVVESRITRRVRLLHC